MSAKRSYTPDEALLMLADACASAEKCEFDCRRKLMQWRIPQADSDRIIDYLYEHSFLDASRYAEAYVNDKARFNRWGKLRLRRELAMKRIPAEAIRQAIDALNAEDYLGFARLAADTALRGVDLDTPGGRQTFVRRMASRGYEWTVIEKIISEKGAETDDLPEYDEELY